MRDVIERRDVFGHFHRVQERQQQDRSLDLHGPGFGSQARHQRIRCGQTVGCESQCCPIDTQAYPMPEAARTTSIASSMIRVGERSAGLQNGVRWNPICIAIGVFQRTPGFPCGTSSESAEAYIITVKGGCSHAGPWGNNEFSEPVFVVAIGLMIYRSYFTGSGGVATMGPDNPAPSWT